MIARLRERFRQWRLTRDLLLVNFGTGPGRIPLVMLSRKKVIDVSQHGSRVSFASACPEHQGWKFTVYAKTTEAAGRISHELTERSRYILEPADDIPCITHVRTEDGGTSEPRLIAGDISISGVPPANYWRHANGAWMLRKVFTEPDA